MSNFLKFLNFLGKIPILKEFEWFDWFEWFGPSPTEPFNSGRRGRRRGPESRGGFLAEWFSNGFFTDSSANSVAECVQLAAGC